MQVTDALIIGGAERVALNLSNLLPRERFEVHLCATRFEGALMSELASDVPRLVLNRKSRIDEPRAVRELASYVRRHGIRLLHCHKNTIFLVSLASCFMPETRILWHDHFGQHEVTRRPPWLYRLGTWRVDGVISVSHALAAWARDQLRFPPDYVWYVPNFVHFRPWEGATPELPQAKGRIICVANLRPQKAIENLVHAMARVSEQEPGVQALVVGGSYDEEYAKEVKREIAELGLQETVLLLGQRSDVPALLGACDVGVLSSASEGLPLTLIEYGMAGLPAVATRVGQCDEVLDGGRVGALVEPGDSDALAEALLCLLRAPEERRRLGEESQRFVQAHYSVEAGLRRIVEIYDQLLGDAEADPDDAKQRT